MLSMRSFNHLDLSGTAAVMIPVILIIFGPFLLLAAFILTILAMYFLFLLVAHMARRHRGYRSPADILLLRTHELHAASLASQLEDKSREVDLAHQRQVDAEYVVEELRDQLRMARDLAKLSQKQADYNSQRMSASNTSVQTTMVD